MLQKIKKIRREKIQKMTKNKMGLVKSLENSEKGRLITFSRRKKRICISFMKCF